MIPICNSQTKARRLWPPIAEPKPFRRYSTRRQSLGNGLAIICINISTENSTMKMRSDSMSAITTSVIIAPIIDSLVCARWPDLSPVIVHCSLANLMTNQFFRLDLWVSMVTPLGIIYLNIFHAFLCHFISNWLLFTFDAEKYFEPNFSLFNTWITIFLSKMISNYRKNMFNLFTQLNQWKCLGFYYTFVLSFYWIIA